MLTNLAFLLALSVSAPGALPVATSAPVEDNALRRAGLTRYWEAQLPLARNDSVKTGHLVEEALYVTTDAGIVFALQADVGLIRWAAKLTEPDYTVYRPAHLGTVTGAGPAVIPTTAQLYIIDRFSGQTVRSFRTAFAPGSAAVGSENSLYMGSADGHFYAVAWNTPVGIDPAERWKVRVGGPITAAPVLDDQGKLIFASQNGKVYSCFAGDKVLDWVFQTGGPVLGDLAVDNHGVYVASSDHSLYKLDRRTGRPIWQYRTPSVLAEGPVVTSHAVYQHCPNYGLVALNVDTGRERWRAPQARAFVADNGDRAVLFTEDGSLDLMNRDSGEIEGTVAAPGVVHAVTNVQHDAVYLLDHRGRVLCARSKDVPYLRPERVTAARAHLTLPPPDEAEVSRPWPENVDDRASLLDDDPLRSRRDLRRP